MTVFVVHPLGKDKIDISHALPFGEIEYVNTRYVYADELEGDDLPGTVTARMLAVVDRWDQDRDYLLIAGDHLQLLAMAAHLTSRWGYFRVLRFDREAKGYIPVQIGEFFYGAEPKTDT